MRELKCVSSNRSGTTNNMKDVDNAGGGNGELTLKLSDGMFWRGA
jgi:hypothetical protein